MSSLLSLRAAVPPSDLRKRIASQRGDSADNASYAASARNVYEWIERLIKESNGESVLENRARRGFRSVLYVSAMSEEPGRGASSSR